MKSSVTKHYGCKRVNCVVWLQTDAVRISPVNMNCCFARAAHHCLGSRMPGIRMELRLDLCSSLPSFSSCCNIIATSSPLRCVAFSQRSIWSTLLFDTEPRVSPRMPTQPTWYSRELVSWETVTYGFVTGSSIHFMKYSAAFSKHFSSPAPHCMFKTRLRRYLERRIYHMHWTKIGNGVTIHSFRRSAFGSMDLRFQVSLRIIEAQFGKQLVGLELEVFLLSRQWGFK